jgi:hypothetical protein
VNRCERDTRLLNAAPVSTVGDGPLPRLRRKRDERRTLKSLEEALIAERHADEHFVESADRGMCHQADLAEREFVLRKRMEELRAVDFDRRHAGVPVNLDFTPDGGDGTPAGGSTQIRCSIVRNAIHYGEHPQRAVTRGGGFVVVLRVLIAVDDAALLVVSGARNQHARADDVVLLPKLRIRRGGRIQASVLRDRAEARTAIEGHCVVVIGDRPITAHRLP